MPSYNTGKYLRETLDTLVNQTYEDWELVVADGGSTDNTLDVLAEYDKKYPGKIVVVSENDEGPYDATHKALRRARGEFVLIFPISDGYVDMNWISECVRTMDENRDVSLVWGIPMDMNEAGEIFEPNYVYAHFLRKDLQKSAGRRRGLAAKEVAKKLDPRKPGDILAFFKKINPGNIKTFFNMLRTKEVPQKREWFEYWLKTGQIFPDANMCVATRVMRECLPQYTPGTREPGDWMGFYFNFNSNGYLAYCIPTPANYGRFHGGQISEKWKKYNDENRLDYYRKLKGIKASYRRSKDGFKFRDRNGNEIKG